MEMKAFISNRYSTDIYSHLVNNQYAGSWALMIIVFQDGFNKKWKETSWCLTDDKLPDFLSKLFGV